MKLPLKFWRKMIGLVLFSSAFGYVEAAVVAYLRSIYEPMRRHFYPALHSGDLFPLLSFPQLHALGPEHVARLGTELGRELATLLMLAGVAIAAEKKSRDSVAAFLFCFGVWDITFYLSLKLLLNWPASLLTWDILFLLPVPWVGPVIAPIVVSASMILCAGYALCRSEHGSPVVLNAVHWFGVLTGGLLVIVAFIWDFRNTSAGGLPERFNWLLFTLGELIGVGSFLAATVFNLADRRTR